MTAAAKGTGRFTSWGNTLANSLPQCRHPCAASLVRLQNGTTRHGMKQQDIVNMQHSVADVQPRRYRTRVKPV